MRLTAALSSLAMFLPALSLAQQPVSSASPSWSEQAAARYLDARENWWLAWPKAQRDHATACVSCHTAVPYALARPALRQDEASPSEQTMLTYVVKRVRLWNEVEPFYTDQKVAPPKSTESRGTESVLNALILANHDSYTGRLSQDTKLAFQNMWSLQLASGDKAGAWNWLNFHNAPWESDESQYWGATLAAVAIGKTPVEFRSDPTFQPNLRALQAYLRKEYASQPLANKAAVLWASAKLPDLLTADEKNALADALFSQQQADAGWTLSTLGSWKRKDNTELDKRSDGYATGLVVLAFEDTGQVSPRIERALKWLAANQDPKDGSWPGYSLNKQHKPTGDGVLFMTDAATAYAVMALQKSESYSRRTKSASAAAAHSEAPRPVE